MTRGTVTVVANRMSDPWDRQSLGTHVTVNRAVSRIPKSARTTRAIRRTVLFPLALVGASANARTPCREISVTANCARWMDDTDTVSAATGTSTASATMTNSRLAEPR